MSMPQDAAGQVRAFADMLAMTQWLSPKELHILQLGRAAKLLRHARRTAPYYRDWLNGDLERPEALAEIWPTIPILTRHEAIKSRLKLASRKTPPESGPVRNGKTSGSTGAPFAFKRSVVSDVAATALTERMLGWWSVDGGKALAHIANDANKNALPPEGRTTTSWHSKHPEGLKHFLSAVADVETQLDWLLARRPHYLGSYPSLLKELALRARARGAQLRFDLVLSFAAVLDAETRDLVRAVFGAEIADTYGAEDAGHLAAQCHDCGEYHVSAETTVVEVLRDDGSTAAPGEIGRVVVTPLYSFAMPLIRYEIGDMAEVGSRHPACGRGLPTLRRILGRSRNVFRFRDGTAIWPITGPYRLTDYIALKHYQIVQTDFDHLEIRYVPADIEWPIDVAALTERIRSVLRQPVEITVRRVDRIDRSPTGKYEECLSLIPADSSHLQPAHG